jgi:photosystem II stability/assembly factor-like uncharacterized protein
MRQGIGVTGVVLKGVSFLGPDIGTVVGDEAGLLHTTDGGATWTPLSFPGGHGPFDDAYQGSPDQIIVTNAGGALRSDDGGATWTFTQFTGLCDALGCSYFIRISFLSATEWWAAGQYRGRFGYRGTIHHTINGGASWSFSLETVNPIVAFNAIYFSSTSTGTAVGSVGTIMRTTNGGAEWTEQTRATANELMAVSFIDDNIGIVGGGHETILRTTTGGE